MKRWSRLPKVGVEVAVGLLLALGMVSSAGAITNGQPDGDQHPYVGLLVFDAPDNDGAVVPMWRCSGSLIAPTVVLTAGHCTDGAVAARVWFLENVTYDAVPFPLYPFGGSGSGAIEGTPHTNPNYRMGSGGKGLPGFAYRDVGVVVLNEPVAMAEYAMLPEAGLVDTLRNKTPVDFVGYGVQDQAKIPGHDLPKPPPYYRWMGARVRLQAPSELVSGKFVHAAEFLRLALNPGGGSGGMCFGDSGGPDLLAGTTTILGVNSYGSNINCAGVGYSQRIDIPAVLEWINSFTQQ